MPKKFYYYMFRLLIKYILCLTTDKQLVDRLKAFCDNVQAVSTLECQNDFIRQDLELFEIILKKYNILYMSDTIAYFKTLKHNCTYILILRFVYSDICTNPQKLRLTLLDHIKVYTDFLVEVQMAAIDTSSTTRSSDQQMKGLSLVYTPEKVKLQPDVLERIKEFIKKNS